MVWFWPSRANNDPKPTQPYAATVAYVHGNKSVNVSYVDHAGNQGAACSVPLMQEGDETPHGYYAEWMPFQKGQAAQTERAEQAATGSTIGGTANRLGG